MSKKGFTLIELLVVISIIAILAGLLLPAITSAREKARMLENKNNVKQISTMLVAYENDYGTFPQYGAVAISEVQASESAFELLASTMQMSFKSFNNPTVAAAFKIDSAPAALATLQGAPTGTWAATTETSYNYDPATPSSNAASVRPVLGDNDARGFWGGAKVIVAFGDSHVETIEADTSGNFISEGSTGGDDNIYTDAEGNNIDAADASTWGQGSNTRAYLR